MKARFIFIWLLLAFSITIEAQVNMSGGDGDYEGGEEVNDVSTNGRGEGDEVATFMMAYGGNSLTIRSLEEAKIMQYTIINSSGNMVMQKNVSPSQQQVEVNVSSFLSGIYYVYVVLDNLDKGAQRFQK